MVGKNRQSDNGRGLQQPKKPYNKAELFPNDCLADIEHMVQKMPSRDDASTTFAGKSYDEYDYDSSVQSEAPKLGTFRKTFLDDFLAGMYGWKAQGGDASTEARDFEDDQQDEYIYPEDYPEVEDVPISFNIY